MDRNRWRFSCPWRVGALALLLASVFACSSGGWYKFSAREIREILPELSYLEASLALYNKPDSVRRASYEYYFSERGHRLSDWDSTMAWYAKYRVNEYEDFYRVASNEMEARVKVLEHKEDSLRALQSRQSKLRDGLIDSVNLLPDSVAFYAYGSLLYRRFSVQPIQAYSDKDSFVLTTHLQGYEALEEGDSLLLSITLRTQDSTTRVFSQPIRSSGLHALGFAVPKGKSVVGLSGFVRGILRRSGKYPFVVMDSLSLIKYPRPTSEETAELDSLETSSVSELESFEEEL